MNARVLAVIVCYNPEPAALEKTLEALQEQSVDCAVIDNASINRKQVETAIAGFTNTQLEGLAQNHGLAYAHNRGIEIAKNGDFTHVLLMDQDSVPLPGMVDRLVEVSIQQSATNKVSAVGAHYNLENSSGRNGESFFVRFGALKFQRHYCSQNDDAFVKADFLISSGSLISLQAIDEIGPMEQDLFIDHIDTEWFLRARDMGYTAFGVCGASMQHALGEQTHQINLAGRRRRVPQHKPFRYYYIFRNSINLYKRGYVSALWKWNDLQRLSLIFILYGFVKAPRLANLSMMLKGVWHGLVGRSGKLDD